jgi:hypothetical protein
MKSVGASRLEAWSDAGDDRRTKKIAVVALALLLATVLFAILRDGTELELAVAPSSSPDDLVLARTHTSSWIRLSAVDAEHARARRGSHVGRASAYFRLAAVEAVSLKAPPPSESRHPPATSLATKSANRWLTNLAVESCATGRNKTRDKK